GAGSGSRSGSGAGGSAGVWLTVGEADGVGSGVGLSMGDGVTLGELGSSSRPVNTMIISRITTAASKVAMTARSMRKLLFPVSVTVPSGVDKCRQSMSLHHTDAWVATREN